MKQTPITHVIRVKFDDNINTTAIWSQMKGVDKTINKPSLPLHRNPSNIFRYIAECKSTFQLQILHN